MEAIEAQGGLLLSGRFRCDRLLKQGAGVDTWVGAWVTRQACEQAKAWNDALPPDPECPTRRLAMAVNLSARQLQDPGLVDMVAAALHDTGLEPAALVLEITESATVNDTQATIARLQALKALGVGLAIDDFGTGFAVDLVKIDRTGRRCAPLCAWPWT
jgi:EAL domain-containing protein (putative c-di-GMP-specific phosphodiesterase class I)